MKCRGTILGVGVAVVGRQQPFGALPIGLPRPMTSFVTSSPSFKVPRRVSFPGNGRIILVRFVLSAASYHPLARCRSQESKIRDIKSTCHLVVVKYRRFFIEIVMDRKSKSFMLERMSKQQRGRLCRVVAEEKMPKK